MFEKFEPFPPDPLLGLTLAFRNDPRPSKIDLGVGVFRNANNETPVMKAVKSAERAVVEAESSKAYISPEGAPGFNEGLQSLLFGADHPALKDKRVQSVQTPGGCGALRIGGELLVKTSARGVTIGAPTWPNHLPLLEAAGLTVSMADFYVQDRGEIAFDRFMDAVQQLGVGDVLLLHGGCHNPTGADLSHGQVSAIIDAAQRLGFLPFVDMAYHGFAESLDADALIVREMAAKLPEILVSYSCSKNFGLYRERTGALIVVSQKPESALAVQSHIAKLARGSYSMPPSHGGFIVSKILNTPELDAEWRSELEQMAREVRANRTRLVETATGMGLGGRFDYVAQQNGMFSLLPVNAEQVGALRERHGIYMAASGRVNMCGLNAGNTETFCAALKDVLVG